MDKNILIGFLFAWLLTVHVVLLKEKYALGYCVATIETIAKYGKQQPTKE